MMWQMLEGISLKFQQQFWRQGVAQTKLKVFFFFFFLLFFPSFFFFFSSFFLFTYQPFDILNLIPKKNNNR